MNRNCWIKKLSFRSVWVSVFVLTALAVMTVPVTFSRYTAQGAGSASARVAKFDMEVVSSSFNPNTLIYWHVANYDNGNAVVPSSSSYFKITMKNTSEVAVRAHLVFYNAR